MMRFPLILCSMFAATVLAQDPVAEEGKPHAEPGIQHDATTLLLPPGSYEFGSLIDAGAEFLEWNILSNPREYQGVTVALQKTMQLDKDTVEEALCELFFSRGFVLVPQNPHQNLYEVIAIGGAKGQTAMQTAPVRSVTEVLEQPHLKQPVTTSVTLHHVDGILCQNAIRPFLAAVGGNSTAGLTINSMGPRSLLLQGMQHDVARAIAMIREVDGPPPQEVVDAEPRLKKLQKQIRELQKQLKELRK